MIDQPIAIPSDEGVRWTTLEVELVASLTQPSWSHEDFMTPKKDAQAMRMQNQPWLGLISHLESRTLEPKLYLLYLQITAKNICMPLSMGTEI